MEKNKKKKKLESQNLTQQNERITFLNINELPNEMLARIFSFLPIKGQLKIVSVCKLWNQLIHNHLAVSKSISLNGYTLEQSKDAVVSISKNCPKLENLSVTFNDGDEETSESSSSGKLFPDLFCENDSYHQLGETHGNKLKQVSINGCRTDYNEVKILMQKCSQLEVIRGDSYKFIDKETPLKKLKEAQIIISSWSDLDHFNSLTEAYNNQIIGMFLKIEHKIYYFDGFIPAFQQISRFKHLKQLSFDSDFKLNEGSLPAFKKLMNTFSLNCTQLESFEFDVDLINTQNTGIQILSAFEAFNGLIHLKIWSKEVPKMQQESVSYLNCKELESFSTNIPINISKIGQYLSNLTSINLQTDFIYTDSDLCSLANLIKLKSIKLSTDTMFSLVTDDGVNRLIDSCRNLNDIKFSFQPMINSRTLSALKSRAETIPSTDVKFICGNNKYGTKKVYSNLYVDHYNSLFSQPLPFDGLWPICLKECLRELEDYSRQCKNPLGDSSLKLGICARIVSQKVSDTFKLTLSYFMSCIAYIATLKAQDLFLSVKQTISRYSDEYNRDIKFSLSQIIHEALLIVEKLAQLDKRINEIITCKLLNKDLINNQFIKSLAQILGQVYWFIELKLYVIILSLVQLHTIPMLDHYICYMIPVLVIN
jgi:hypothetical protein